MSGPAPLTREALVRMVATSSAPAHLKGLATLAIVRATKEQLVQVAALIEQVTANPENARAIVSATAKTWGVPDNVIADINTAIGGEAREG